MSRTGTLTDEEKVDAVLNGEDKYYTPVEVAHILRVQVATVQAMCRDGRLEAKKINNIWHVLKSEIKRYLLEGARKPGAKNE